MHSFDADNISQFGHIMGGICGGFFGFFLNKSKLDKEDTGLMV